MFYAVRLASLVSSLNETNYNSHCKEASDLCAEHGADAYISLLKCLLRSVNITDGQPNKDRLPQTLLLAQELPNLLDKPWRDHVFCAVFASPEFQVKGKFPLDLLPQMATLLRLSATHEVIIASVLAQSGNPDLENAATSVLKLRLPELLRAPDASLDPAVLHQLLLLVTSPDATIYASKDDLLSYLAALRKILPRGSVPDVLAPLLYSERTDVHADTFAACASRPEARAVMELITSQTPLAEIMLELGYACCSTPAAAKALLAPFDSSCFSPDTIVAVIGMMARIV
jgi:hypothetical protein